VDAQQARRVLDRIVDTRFRPCCGQSAARLERGRVQTVALRLIVEREQEIRAFIPQEYWSIHAMLDAESRRFSSAADEEEGEDVEVKNQETADAIVAAVSKAKWQVASVALKEKRRYAPPPFTTSKLQQAGYNRLRYTAKRTMALAQRLYEGVELGEEGSVALITYMRTDSVQVSNDALEQVRELIPERLEARTCRKNRISTNRKKMRRARTKQFGRRKYRAPRKTCGNTCRTTSSSCTSSSGRDSWRRRCCQQFLTKRPLISRRATIPSGRRARF